MYPEITLQLTDKVRILDISKAQKDRYFNNLMDYCVEEIIKMERDPSEVLQEAIMAVDMEFRFRNWENSREYTGKIDKFLNNQRFKMAKLISQELRV